VSPISPGAPRSRALLLLLPLLLLLIAPIVMALAKSQKRSAAQELMAEAEGLARRSAEAHRHRTESAHDLLSAIAQGAELKRGDWAAASAMLTEVLREQKSVLDLRLLDPLGQSLGGATRPGNAPPIPAGLDLVAPLAGNEFAIGAYRSDPATGKAFIPCLLRLHDAVLIAALDLSWLGSLVQDSGFPVGGELVFVDPNGLVLAEFPEGACPAGLAQRLVDKRQGMLDFVGSDGTARVASVAPFAAAGGNRGLVAVTLLAAALYGPAEQSALRGLVGLMLGAGILLVVIAAGLLARPRRILPPGGEPAPIGARPPEGEIGTATDQVKRVQHQTKTIAMLTEMGGLLHESATVDEAYGVVGRFAQVFFPDLMGALLVPGTDPGRLQVATEWGTFPAVRLGGDAFARSDCLALETGATWRVEDTATGRLCRHLVDPMPTSYVCIPMQVQGEVLGVLHVACPRNPARSRDGLPEFRRQLGERLAEHIALALQNLETRESLRTQSIRDSLTGLYNRRFLEERLAEEVSRAQRKERPLGLILLDLDHFKRLNDTSGHDAGDAYLRGLGTFVQDQFRESDVVCRYGGEEFVVILPEAGLADTRQRAENLRALVRGLRVPYRDRELDPLTVSLGVASYPMHGATPAELLKAADEALYRAKNEGRDRACIAAEVAPKTAEAEPKASPQAHG